jgi:hypothetical protein
MSLSDLDEIINRMRYVMTGDVIEPDDHNITVDAIKKIREILSQISVAPAPSIAVFDYIIDIYSDRIVITGSDGKTTEISSIDELNNWFKNNKGKKIRINTHTVVSNDLILTQNEYWVIGKEIIADIVLTEKNISLYMLTPVYPYTNRTVSTNFITNYDPSTGQMYDVSGLNLFATHANIHIEGNYGMPITDINIFVMTSIEIYIYYASGNLYAPNVIFFYSEESVFKLLYVVSLEYMFLDDVSPVENSYWFIMSLGDTYTEDLQFGYNMHIEVRLRYMIYGIVIGPGASVTFYIERPPLVAGYIYVDFIGASVGPYGGIRAINPLPPGVTYSFDPSRNTITITNNTSSIVTIDVAFIVNGYWFRLR